MVGDTIRRGARFRAGCARRTRHTRALLAHSQSRQEGAAAVEAAVGLPLLVFLTLAALQFSFVAISAVSIESSAVAALSSAPVTSATRAEVARIVEEQVLENALCLSPETLSVDNVTISTATSLERGRLADDAGTAGPFDIMERGSTTCEIEATIAYDTPILLGIGPNHTVKKTVHAFQQVSSYVEVNVE